MSGRFESVVLAHLDAAYNLARWIVRDEHAAQDIVQDASLRALRHLETQPVTYPRAWFMAIVRNVCLDWLKDQRRTSDDESYEEQIHGAAGQAGSTADLADPAFDAIRAADARWLRESIERLPRQYREVIVLRELDELSYKEISTIVNVPIGTVMSRISRARDLLQRMMMASAKRAGGQ